MTQTLAETDPEAASRIRLHSNGNSTRHTQQLLSDLYTASGTGTAASSTEPPPLLDNATTITTTSTTRRAGQLFVVADEVESTFRGVFDELRNNVEDLHVWAASYSHRHRPEGMAERRLSACLRSTPVVMRRMETAVSFDRGSVYRWVVLRLRCHDDGFWENV